MVNDRFLLVARYGFERVDARFAPGIGNRTVAHAESRDFCKKALQIKVNAITWDLSRAAKGPL